MKLLRMESLLPSTSQKKKKKQRLRVGRWMFQDTSWHLEEVDSVIDVRGLLRIFPLPSEGKAESSFAFFMSL